MLERAMANHQIQTLFDHVANVFRQCASLRPRLIDVPELDDPHSSSLMRERLTQSGVDPDYVLVVQPDLYRELQRICDTCPDPDGCARDLARGDLEVGMRKYCPNAAAIDELIVGDRLKKG
jgi:hypothetical protein